MSYMAAPSAPIVLTHTIPTDQLVIPGDFMPEEINQEIRREAYGQRILSLNMVCVVCFEIACNPRTGHDCGATLCTPCVTSAFAAKANRCPKCNKTAVHPEQLTASHYGRSFQGEELLANVRVSCVFECGAIDFVRNMPLHQATMCPRRMIPCKYCKKNIRADTLDEHVQTCETACNICKQMVRVIARQEHLEQSCMSPCTLCNELCLSIGLERHKTFECTQRPVSCPQCKDMIPYSKMKMHIKEFCGMTQIECPRGCGINYARKEQVSHETQCEQVIVTCDICQHQCIRGEMAAHKANPLPHIDYFVKTQRTEIDGLSRANSKLMQLCMELSMKVEASDKKVDDMSRQVLESQLARHQLPQQMAQVAHTVAILQADALHCKVNNDHLANDMSMMKSHMTAFFPLMLPSTITHEHRTMYLAELTNHNCDFCPLVQGYKQRISKTMGRCFGYRAPGTEDIDMCLTCASNKCVKTKEMLSMMPTCVAEQLAAEPTVKRVRFVAPEQTSQAAASDLRGPREEEMQASMPASRPIVGKPPRQMVPGFIYKITPFNARTTANKAKIVVQSHHVEIEGMMVRRGPNWRHDNQDGDGVGVIVRHNVDSVLVSWQNGVQEGNYYIDMNGEHHLVYA